MDEFTLISDILAPLAGDAPEALGLADDAAVIGVAPDVRLVVTNDMIVAGVHFRSDDPPGLVARKLLRVNLSDLAAMGAAPRAYLAALAIPRGTGDDWIRAFAGGLADDQAAYGVRLIGGDIVSTEGPFTASVTALGEVAAGAELRRSGARPGDIVYVSGTLGDAALGLKALRGELADIDDAARVALVERYHLPQPRLALGAGLGGLARAAIDVSDGLVADVGHIAKASNAGAEIDAARLPLSGEARAALAAYPALRPLALGGGDDYEIAFTVDGRAADDVARLSDALGLPLTAIGRIVEGAGVSVLDEAGAPVTLRSGGYRHG